MRKIIVAGGATGIGAEVIRALRAGGDDIVLIDRNVTDGERLVSESARGSGTYLEADLADAERTIAATEEAIDLLGGSVDALFFNAGLLIAHPLAEWSVDDWDRTAAVNLRAPFLMVQAAHVALAASGRGRVVITSSTAALRGHAGMPAYHSTKAGVLGLVRSLADELAGEDITVNAICPGWVDTPFNDQFWHHQADPARALRDLEQSIPLGRQAAASEIVGSVLFLISDEASYVTGQSLVVDGGYTAV